MEAPGARLRHLLATGETHVLASSYDALTARISESMGFEIHHLTGFGAAAALTGGPDIGLVTMTEMVDSCRRICSAVSGPVIADGDTGYGNVLNVVRTIQAFEGAGAAGVHIEDQVTPKRCGHMVGKELISTAEMSAKIRAAVDARQNDDFVIIARTDARAVEGLDAAINRATTYKEAGADVLFVEAPETLEEIEAVANRLPGPILYNWAYQGRSPHVPLDTLKGLGFALVLFADVALVVHKALSKFFGQLHTANDLDELSAELTSFDSFNEFVGLSGWRDLEHQYTTGDLPAGATGDQ
jgi:2-methylisocitrate lyase-like PEP mutase family enzyme